MATYDITLTWKALEDLFTLDPELLATLLADESGDLLRAELQSRLPHDDVNDDLKVLELLAYEVTEAIEDDFKELIEALKDESPLLRGAVSPYRAKQIIDAFENRETPAVGDDSTELILGIYLILRSGEKALPEFKVLSALAELETPPKD